MITLAMNFDSPEAAVTFLSGRSNSSFAPSVQLEEPCPIKTDIDTIMSMLNDEQYESRKLATLAKGINKTEGYVLDLLDKEGIDYSRLTKRSTGEFLIRLN